MNILGFVLYLDSDKCMLAIIFMYTNTCTCTFWLCEALGSDPESEKDFSVHHLVRARLEKSRTRMLNDTVLAVLSYVHEGLVADVAFLQV